MTTYTPGDSYQEIPLPGFTKPTHTYGSTFGDEFHAPTVFELLASDAGHTQRGVTVAGGQGVIPTGTVLGQNSTNKKYYVYKSTNSDGTQVPLGFLRNGVDSGGAASPTNEVSHDVQGLLVDRGIVNYSVTSGVDSNAITLLNGRVDNAVSRFYF